MAEAVAEVLVVGTEASVCDDLAGGIVDGVAGKSRASRGQSCGLRLVDDVEDLLLSVGGFAEDEGAGDVGLVAFDIATVIDQNNLVLANDLRLQRAVGQRGVLSDLAGGIAGDATAGVRSNR